MTGPIVFFDVLWCKIDLGFDWVFIIYYISNIIQDKCVFVEVMICISTGIVSHCRDHVQIGGVKDSGSAVILIDSPSSKIVISRYWLSSSCGHFSYKPCFCNQERLSARILSLPFICLKVIKGVIKKISTAQFWVSVFFVWFLINFSRGGWSDFKTTSASYR